MMEIKRSKIEGFPQIFDCGQVSNEAQSGVNLNTGFHFMVMDKFDLSLKDVLFKTKGTKLKCSDVVKVGISVLKSLERLHSIGIIHNDIKLDNICIQLSQKSKDRTVLLRAKDKHGRLNTHGLICS